MGTKDDLMMSAQKLRDAAKNHMNEALKDENTGRRAATSHRSAGNTAD